MRMWGAPPARMCQQHLLGEHVELHMMVGTLNKHTSMEGYYSKGLLDTDLIVARHTELVEEMTRRGMQHKTPLPWFENPHRGHVAADSAEELWRRCEKCRSKL